MYADFKSSLSLPIVSKLVCFSVGSLLVIQITTGLITYFSLDGAKDQRNLRVVTNDVVNQSEFKTSLSVPVFGDYVQKYLVGAEVKRSMLNLTVVGIIVSSEDGDSQVIIKAAGGHEQTFRVGDHVPGGAMIKRITADGVFVMRNGSLESLSLPKNELIFDAPAKPLK